MRLKLFMAVLTLGVCFAAYADVHVQELPGSYVVRASGPASYTAIIDRSDGHLSTLAVGDGKRFSDAEVSPLAAKDAPAPAGWFAVVRDEKPVLARGLAAAAVSTPRAEGEAFVISVTTGDGSKVDYRF